MRLLETFGRTGTDAREGWINKFEDSKYETAKSLKSISSAWKDWWLFAVAVPQRRTKQSRIFLRDSALLLKTGKCLPMRSNFTPSDTKLAKRKRRLGTIAYCLEQFKIGCQAEWLVCHPISLANDEGRLITLPSTDLITALGQCGKV